MSHIVCPLCGKNSPLSTFNPEGLDLDLRVVSFRGLGRGKGFAKSEDNSVLGDEEYSPAVAGRVVDLCRMFLASGVLTNEEVVEKLGLGFVGEENKRKVEVLQQQLADERAARANHQVDYSTQVVQERKPQSEMENQLRALEMELEKRREEDEKKAIVDHILSEGFSLLEPSYIGINDSGWWVNLSEDTPEFTLYLKEVSKHLTSELKERLLERVKAEGYLKIFVEHCRTMPRELTKAEKVLGIGSPETVQGPDGRTVTYESIPFEFTLTRDAVDNIVANAKRAVLSPAK